MKVIVTQNYEESCAVVANMLADVVRADSTACLGLATGGSMEGVYAQLVSFFRSGTGKICFKSVKTVNLDEYVGLSAGHPQSYRTYMENHFFAHVDVDKKNICVPLGTEAYEKMLQNFQDFLDTHPRSLQLLGLGANGHIGFNEPGAFLKSNAHVVDLDDHTRKDNARFFASLDDVPRQAVTMGVGDILKASQIALLVHGNNKLEALRQLLLNDKVTPEWPCTILKLHPTATLVVTEELMQAAKV